MNAKPELMIRHPIQIPIEVKPVVAKAGRRSTGHKATLPSLAFDFPYKLNVGTTVMVSIPSVQKGARVRGRVVWLIQTLRGYVVGMAFFNENEAFRMRMLEQICHIEAYRKKVELSEGRLLTREQAAAEWISCHAADFPGSLPLAA